MARERVVSLSFKRTLVVALGITVYGVLQSIAMRSIVGIVFSLVNLALFIVLYLTVFRR
jgi:hypothetical protein